MGVLCIPYRVARRLEANSKNQLTLWFFPRISQEVSDGACLNPRLFPNVGCCIWKQPRAEFMGPFLWGACPPIHPPPPLPTSHLAPPCRCLHASREKRKWSPRAASYASSDAYPGSQRCTQRCSQRAGRQHQGGHRLQRASLVPGASQPLLNHRPLESMASGPAFSSLFITTACRDSSKPWARPPCQSPTDSSPQDRQCQDDGPGPQPSCALPVWPSQLDPAASSLRLWTEVYPWL